MAALQGWRVLAIPFQRTLVRNVGSIASEPSEHQTHIFKRNYTEEQLIQYLLDNTVQSDRNYVVTSVPQGVSFVNVNMWNDGEGERVCDKSLQDMLPNLKKAFNAKELFVTKHPRRNASGLLLLSKNVETFMELRSHISQAKYHLIRIFTYLAIVIGQPVDSYVKTFSIDQRREDGVAVTHIVDETFKGNIKVVDTKYQHKVIDSTEEFTLLEISVSYDLRDCVRHILAQKCFTPVFGDSWNIKKATNFLFGVPLSSKPELMRDGPYTLTDKTLKKLHLTAEEKHLIPVHAHLYSINLPLSGKAVFFASVPPPKYFSWTCQQLGLHKISNYMT